MKRLIHLLSLVVLASMLVWSCSEEDDSGTNGNNNTDPWVGTWLSADADVAPLLAAVFSIDSVRVEMKDDGSVFLDQHVMGAGWTSNSGTYTVTESASGNVHSISISYSSPAFEQEGIVEITEGSPDVMRLEVVQTVPDIGATPRTPATGFGSDTALGTSNIQTYRRVE